MRGQRPLDNYYTAEVYIFERKCGIDTNHQCCKMKKNMCVAREAKEAAKLVLFATGWKSAPRDEPVKLALSSSPAVPILPLRGIFQSIVSMPAKRHGRSPHGWRNLSPKAREEGDEVRVLLPTLVPL